MDYILLFLGFFLVVGGIIGSFLPVIPGPPTGWLGILLLNLTSKVITDWTFIGITLAVAILVVIADYIIPALGAKKFGGSKYGIWGSAIGLIIGLLFPPIGMILGLFLGALVGELIHDHKNMKKAIKASIGSVIGFFFSTGIKLIVGIVFLVYFIKIVIENKDAFF
ncbi:DUF456 domain-containing protein [Wenyingzhuangia marina]|uniref:DUF456 domain-containing protein n=1 Tax=Wenyingzhuangia marina TaxID=1195760 RepID=A0A1M5SP15_9FLAO|nr:DUF456 domain-containing protein [Wenyingzhuangia marina]GGF63229.1 membrane protein [Wenyingzhuangia marina]SHH40225.1 hypothetical protein SAMN05444281_0422 [Wenyingzhuangia marina]